MSTPSKGKSIIDQMLNAVTSRDEKAALDSAKQLIAEMEKQVAEAEKKAQLNAQRADAAEKKVAELQKELQTAKTSIASLEKRALEAETQVKRFENEKLLAQQRAAAQEAAKSRIIATHTLTSKETLSDLALKYYGHATPAYWKIIYEANKDVIGPNPNAVRPGMVIQIPVLPESMK